VISLVKDDHEDDYLRELWRSIVTLRGSYLYHASKLRRKRKGKAKRKRLHNHDVKKPTVETGGSGASLIKDPILDPPSILISHLTPSVPTSQKPPVNEAPVSQAPPPLQVPVKPTVVTSTSVTFSKPWVDVVSPPKPIPPALSVPVVVPKVPSEQAVRPQPPYTSGEKGVKKADPPKIIKESEPDKKVRKIKVSSSSSSESVPKPKTKPTLTRSKSQVVSEHDFGRYRQWIREFSRQGIDVKAIKKLDVESDAKLKLYCVWVGRSLGIYKDWDSCRAVVDKFQGSQYKKCEGTLVNILKEYKQRLEQTT